MWDRAPSRPPTPQSPSHWPVADSLPSCPTFFFQARLLEETRRFGNVSLKLNVTSARHERSCRLRQGGHRSLGGLMEAGVRTGSSHLSLPSFSLTKSRGRWEEEHCLSGDVVSYRPLRAQLSLGGGPSCREHLSEAVATWVGGGPLTAPLPAKSSSIC